MNEPVQEELVVRCTRCGTTRQRHVPLAMQRCPVRTCWLGAGEVAEGTATCAARVIALKAMHGLGARGRPADAGAGQPPQAAVHAEPNEQHVVLEPGVVALRPFRSHVVVRIGEAEVCMLCFSRAPRHKVVAWREVCCDGVAPLGSCPQAHPGSSVHAPRVMAPSQGREGGRNTCIR